MKTDESSVTTHGAAMILRRLKGGCTALCGQLVSLLLVWMLPLVYKTEPHTPQVRLATQQELRFSVHGVRLRRYKLL